MKTSNGEKFGVDRQNGYIRKASDSGQHSGLQLERRRYKCEKVGWQGGCDGVAMGEHANEAKGGKEERHKSVHRV